MPEIKPIETYYNGYKFRSRTEARWAVFFDSLKIKWIYEPEGINIDGVCYLPDFYLPESKQFFEVKGILTDVDMIKVSSLINAGYSVTIGYDDGKFIACDLWGEDDKGKGIYDLCTCDTSFLCKCKVCGKHWFMGSAGHYKCQCCGSYDGDHHFTIQMEYYNYVDECGKLCEGGDTDLWNVARQARFEHGEKPITERNYRR